MKYDSPYTPTPFACNKQVISVLIECRVRAIPTPIQLFVFQEDISKRCRGVG